MTSSHLKTRSSRKRVQSENMRWVARSKPPKIPSVHSRWYHGQCSLTRKWICRSSSIPNSTMMVMPLPLRAIMRTASGNGRIGSSAIELHTRANHASANSSRNFTRSQSASFLRVVRWCARGISPGSGSPSRESAGTGAGAGPVITGSLP
jgi:hypothetical protein